MVGYKVKDVTDVHGADEPIDFHEPDWHGGQCQSGTWSVSNAENPHGWKPNYFAGSVATYDANRIVKCGFYDEYNFYGGTHRTDLSGKCSYIVVCQ